MIHNRGFNLAELNGQCLHNYTSMCLHTVISGKKLLKPIKKQPG
jgi:hypothetical protein